MNSIARPRRPRCQHRHRACCRSLSRRGLPLLLLVMAVHPIRSFPIRTPGANSRRWSSGGTATPATRPDAVAFTENEVQYEADGGGVDGVSATGTAAGARPTLSDLQRRAAPVASSFSTRDEFDPLVKNGHLQTIVPFFLREKCSYIPRSPGALANILPRIVGTKTTRDCGDSSAFFWDDRERIETPDGDWFHADTKYADAATLTADAVAPTVILLHGLQSNSNSTICVEMARAFTRHGMDTVCLNFRGCSGQINDKWGGYHLGFDGDLLYYLQLFQQRQRQRRKQLLPGFAPVFLSGFSLGANVVLKCLGQLGEKATEEYGVVGAAVSCKLGQA